MAYLFFRDYKRLIQNDNLNQIIGNDTLLVTENESVAVTEMKSYLVQKYDVTREFSSIELFSLSKAYQENQRVYLDADLYDITRSYVADADLCLYGGKIYVCNDNTTGAFDTNDWTLLGTQYDIFYTYYTNGVFDYYKQYAVNDRCIYLNKIYKALKTTINVNPLSDATAWLFESDYTTHRAYPTDTTVWKIGDNRNQQLVNYCIDIMLYHTHSRIAPRNIPELRVKRYDDAVYWLKQCATGEDITAGLTLLQPTQGLRTRYGGSNSKNINTY